MLLCRLLLIAKQEKISTDLTSMMALADKSGNDVRSCLSMLQFCSSLKKPIRLTDVLKCNVGQKDRHKGLFGIWSAIFQVCTYTFFQLLFYCNSVSIYKSRHYRTNLISSLDSVERCRTEILDGHAVNLQRRGCRFGLLDARSPFVRLGSSVDLSLSALALRHEHLRLFDLGRLARTGSLHAQVGQLDCFPAKVPDVPTVLVIDVGRHRV